MILQLSRKGWSGRSNSIKPQPIMATTSDHREYSVLTGQMDIATEPNGKSPLKTNSKIVAFAVAYPSLHSTIEVQSQSQSLLVMQTFINYTKPLSGTNDGQAAIVDLKVSLRETIKKVVALSPISLQQQHEAAWQSLWLSGFSITHSHAPQAVNGYQINATLYYLLTQRKMPVSNILEMDSHQTFLPEVVQNTDMDSMSSELRLFKPDRCYNGHSTFHVSNSFYQNYYEK